jgi:hypothetical protein
MDEVNSGGLKKKGGTTFPRYDLGELIDYLKPIHSKTYNTTLNLDQMSSGVFGLKVSVTAKIKLSALRQFGLVNGLNDALSASKLCADIAIRSGDERLLYLQQAFFKVKPFEEVFKTFKGGEAQKDKIAQYATDSLGVHPDNAPEFARIFIKSAIVARLGVGDENSIALNSINAESTTEVPQNTNQDIPQITENEKQNYVKATKPGVTIQVDATLDPEKLKKQLDLLKQYGLI